MIHQYKLGDFNIVLDVCSGSVHAVDDVAYDIIGLFEENGKSHSAIMLLKSDDGVNFEFVKPFLVPQKQGNSNWMAQYVYACCLTYYNGKLRLYFNARNVSNNLTGRESIGIYEAKV